MSTRTTGALYLDQLQSLGIEGAGLDRGYPKIAAADMEVLRVVAENLFLSLASLAWSYHDALHGKSDSFRAIRDRLMSRPVVLLTREKS